MALATGPGCGRKGDEIATVDEIIDERAPADADAEASTGRFHDEGRGFKADQCLAAQ